MSEPVVRYEIIPSLHEDHVVGQWEMRTPNNVERYRYEFNRAVSIGDVLDVLSEHFARHHQ